MEDKLSNELSRPSGRLETELFSMLNSSRRRQLDRVFGIDSDVRWLYLNPILVRLVS